MSTDCNARFKVHYATYDDSVDAIDASVYLAEHPTLPVMHTYETSPEKFAIELNFHHRRYTIRDEGDFTADICAPYNVPRVLEAFTAAFNERYLDLRINACPSKAVAKIQEFTVKLL